MENGAHPARGSPPYAQQPSAREVVVLMLMREGRLVLPEAVRENRGVHRESVSTGSELRFGLGGENGRASLDRAWVKMTRAVVGIVSDGMAHSRDSRG